MHWKILSQTLNFSFLLTQEFEDHFDDEIDFTPPAEDTPSMQSPAEVYTLAVSPVPLPGPPHLQPLASITGSISSPSISNKQKHKYWQSRVKFFTLHLLKLYQTFWKHISRQIYMRVFKYDKQNMCTVSFDLVFIWCFRIIKWFQSRTPQFELHPGDWKWLVWSGKMVFFLCVCELSILFILFCCFFLFLCR